MELGHMFQLDIWNRYTHGDIFMRTITIEKIRILRNIRRKMDIATKGEIINAEVHQFSGEIKIGTSRYATEVDGFRYFRGYEFEIIQGEKDA